MPQNFRPARNDIVAARNSVPRNLQVPIEDGDYGMLLMFRDYQYRAPGSVRGFAQPDTSNVSDTIFLPLPENIADNFTVRVQRFDQGAMGEAVSSVLSDVSSSNRNLSFGDIQSATIGAVKNLLPGDLTDGAEFQKMLTSAVTNMLGGTSDSNMNRFSSDAAFALRRAIGTVSPNTGRAIDAGVGTMINPKAALSFEGVEMKTHSFNWTVAPKSQRESENLKNVISTINKNILPQYVESGVVQRAMLRYPSMVDVFFVGLDSRYYHFFKTAMVNTFNVNYTPNGISVLKGGKPAAVQMQMNITESDIHTAEDYGADSFRLIDPISSGTP
jgi:hypothetical protein